MPDRVEWVKAVELAEFAEVLKINTALVMSVREDAGVFVALYTPDWPTDHLIWTAVMERDAHDVLQLVGVPEPKPGLWEKMRVALEEARSE